MSVLRVWGSTVREGVLSTTENTRPTPSRASRRCCLRSLRRPLPPPHQHADAEGELAAETAGS